MKPIPKMNGVPDLERGFPNWETTQRPLLRCRHWQTLGSHPAMNHCGKKMLIPSGAIIKAALFAALGGTAKAVPSQNHL